MNQIIMNKLKTLKTLRIIIRELIKSEYLFAYKTDLIRKFNLKKNA